MDQLDETLRNSLATLGPTGGNALTGSPLARIGSGKPLAVSDKLAALDPEDTDNRISAALKRLTGRSPLFETKTYVPNDRPIYTLVSAIRWECPADKLPEVAGVIARSFQAAPEEMLGAALLRLRTLTRGRDERNDIDRTAEMVIWLEQLQCWPGDIALAVIREWPSRPEGQWWPTWHEVEAAIRHRCDKRTALLNFVRVLLANTSKPDAARLPASSVLQMVEPPGEGAKARVAAHWDDVRQMLAGEEPTRPSETQAQLEARLDEWAANPPRVVIGEELTRKLEQYRAAAE